MRGQDVFEKILNTYQSDFDITRPYSINEDVFDAYATLNVSSAKYVLIKKAELWRTDFYEHVFFARKSELNLKDLENFKQNIISYIEPLLVRGGEQCTKKDHMYTNITAIFVVDNKIAEQEKRAVKKFHFFKNYRLGLRGYCEARVLVFDVNNREIIGNRAARTLQKGYKKFFGI